MTKKSNIKSFPSKLDLTLDVNMPHLKDLSHQLGKEIALKIIHLMLIEEGYLKCYLSRVTKRVILKSIGGVT